MLTDGGFFVVAVTDVTKNRGPPSGTKLKLRDQKKQWNPTDTLQLRRLYVALEPQQVQCLVAMTGFASIGRVSKTNVLQSSS